MNVLLAEDDKKLGKLIAYMLQKQNHQVEWLKDGSSVFDYAASGSYHILILDWMLPDEDGVQICKRLRQNGYSGTILMLTARDDIADRVVGLDAGADDYLVKPFSFDELFARLRSLARRMSIPYQDDTFACGDLTINRSQFTVQYQEMMIQLTAKEFTLLDILARNRGKVVSRQILLDQIWGFQEAATDNNLDALVRLVRRKLEEATHQKLIHTIRGVGYKLEV